MVGLVFLVFNLWSFRQNYLLKHSGVTVQGIVTRTGIMHRRGGAAYSVDYGFVAAGKHFEGTGQITPAVYLTLRPGGPIGVLYASSDPSISETSDMSHNNVSLLLIGLLGIPISLFILGVNFRLERLPAQYAYEAPPEPDTTVETEAIELSDDHSGIPYLLRRYYEQEMGLKGGRLSFEVEDVNTFVEQLRKKGVRVKTEPLPTVACRMAVLVDRDGNTFTLYQRTPSH